MFAGRAYTKRVGRGWKMDVYIPATVSVLIQLRGPTRKACREKLAVVCGGIGDLLIVTDDGTEIIEPH